MRRHVRKTNGAAVDWPVAVVEKGSEMEQLDRLGPLCRNAIYNSALSFLASSITAQVDEANQRLAEAGKPPLDMREPSLDARLADCVRDNCLNAMLRDRDPVDARAGLVPLRARRVRRA